MALQTLFDTARDDRRASLLAGGVILISLCGFALLFQSQHEELLRLLNLAYLGLTVTIGFWLYLSNPALYLGFAWWVWFLSPFVRRLIDYQIGTFTPPNQAFVLLAPFVVSGIALFDLPRFGRELRHPFFAPIALCFIAVAYGFLVGLPTVGGFPATVALLSWLCPLLLSFHVMAHWRQYPRYRRVVRATFIGGTLVMGVYGLIQFFVLPPWDALWMERSGMHSIGRAEPMEVRVFSTLSAPGPFATILWAGLLLVFDARSTLGTLSAVPGYIAFLLSLVRSAWGGWMVGMSALVWRFPGRLRTRLVAIMVVLGILIVPIAITGEIAETTGARLESFSSLQDDHSLTERQTMYQQVTGEVLFNPIGMGIGSALYDSGFVTILWQLGWFGGALYLGGLLWLLYNAVFLARPAPNDQFALIVMAVAIGYFTMLLFGREMIEETGAVLWSFLALVLAAHRHHQHQQATEAALSPDASSPQHAYTAH